MRPSKSKEDIWVCPYLSPECGERGLKNQGCHVSQVCHSGGVVKKLINERIQEVIEQVYEIRREEIHNYYTDYLLFVAKLLELYDPEEEMTVGRAVLKAAEAARVLL
jgi:hypothetical protein